MAVERRTLWLGAVLLVVVVVGVVVWSTDGPGTPGRSVAGGTAARAPAASPAREPSTAAGGDQDIVAVNLEALKNPRGEPADLGRDPFRFQARPAPPPPTTAIRPPAANQAAVAPVAPPVPTGPPPPPPIPLKFIGVVEQGAKRIAVLSDGRSPISGVEGDIILGQYRILKIGQESIEMAYVDGRGRQMIRLTGQ